MARESRRGDVLAAVVAAGLGVLIALLDQGAPFGDDSAKLTIVLLFASGMILGLARPRRPWRWSLLVGVWLPALFALNGGTRPDLLLLLCLVVSTLGAYAGAMVRALLHKQAATS
jgi:hypothetical protein